VFAGIDDAKLGPRQAVPVLCGWLTFVAMWLVLAGAPESALQWIALVGVWLVAAILVTVALGGLLELAGSRWPRLRRRHRVVALPALVVGAVLGSGGVVVGLSTSPGEAPEAVCDLPIELRVLAAPSRLAYVRDLVDAYQQWTADRHEGCPTVSGYVYAVPADTAVSHLQSSWEAGLRDVGPRPDLWLPDDTSHVELVRREIEGAGRDLRDLDDQVVAVSPLVLAVTTTAVANGDVRDRDHTWVELLDLAGDLGWDLARPVPAASVVGELATTAMYGAAGRAGSGADVVAFAREVESRIAATLVRHNYPLADTDPLLCRHRQLGPDATDTALIVTEQAAYRFARGDELGVACPASAGLDSGAEAAASLPMELLHPTDTVTVEHPVVTLIWADRSERQARAASDLLGWLSTDAGHAALAAVGLRPPAEEQPPQPEAVARAREAYQAAQQPGRVLLALDTSGSMRRPAGGEHSRYDVALRALEVALHLLSDRDEFGLWVFPERAAGSEEGRRELVPIGAADVPYRGMPRAEAALAALAALEPDAPTTPLHRTIVDAVAAVSPDPERVTALVVLTDGEDTERDPAIDASLAGLGDEGVRVYVVAIGEASCLTEALAGVTSRTGGGCVQAVVDTLDSQLVELFGVLWSGGGPS
jgi:Ca-activated chloride channel homolog